LSAFLRQPRTLDLGRKIDHRLSSARQCQKSPHSAHSITTCNR